MCCSRSARSFRRKGRSTPWTKWSHSRSTSGRCSCSACSHASFQFCFRSSQSVSILPSRLSKIASHKWFSDARSIQWSESCSRMRMDRNTELIPRAFTRSRTVYEVASNCFFRSRLSLAALSLSVTVVPDCCCCWVDVDDVGAAAPEVGCDELLEEGPAAAAVEEEIGGAVDDEAAAAAPVFRLTATCGGTLPSCSWSNDGFFPPRTGRPPPGEGAVLELSCLFPLEDGAPSGAARVACDRGPARAAGGDALSSVAGTCSRSPAVS
mmetsp:Transcript_5682/g.14172  ORF Transcript_5682/g.14172 Transcript_5682/m.14172 type:complete len:266 (+) Transcript_5682:3341-4138(+)